MNPSSSRFGISLVLVLLVLSFGLVYLDHQSGDAAENTLINHFQAIKEQKLTEAYFAYTSKEFQKSTNLEQFKTFIRSIAQIGDDSTLQIEEKQNQENQRSILALITRPQTEPIYFHINLVKEDDEWKIVSWHQSSPEERAQLAFLEQTLDLIRAKKPDEAYSTVTGTEFRKITTPEGFADFLENYPILRSFTSSELLDITAEHHHPIVYVKLQNELQEATIAFTLEQEQGAWKIRGIEVKDQDIQPGVIEPFRKDDLWSVVKDQLKAFQSGNVNEAYQQFTSQGFQQETSFNDFNTFIQEHPIFSKHHNASLENLTFNNNIGVLTVGLETASGTKQAADFSLIHEGDQWRVLQIQLYEPTGR
jgi:hypothetical protein